MHRIAVGFALVAVVAVTVVVVAQLKTAADVPTGRTIVLAELFTSEGCSSCPPADRLLEDLLRQQAEAGVYVIPLSEHVDYWDNQGWKDPFSSAQFTERQKVYGFRFNVDSIYTPQMVIDGNSEFVGSDAGELKRAVAKAGRDPKPFLQVDVAGAGPETTVTISGPGLKAAHESSELMLAITEDGLAVDVKRGENANLTLHHSGVVHLLQSLGDPSGTQAPRGAVDAGVGVVTAKVAVKPEWKRDKLRIVAFVQAKTTRRILAIGFHPL